MNREPVLLLADNPGPLTGRGSNTWLLDGAVPTLIDAGPGAEAHVSAVARALRGRGLARVIVTHGHADHAHGVAHLRERWPSVEACKFVLRGEVGWRALADGERVRAGGRLLTVIHTPGHAPDHIALWDPDGRDLFAGDLILNGTTVVIPGGRGGSLRDYLASLERIAALAPARIYPGHGPAIEQPAEAISAYIAHRRARETQVLACLHDGLTDVDTMVARIYPDLPPALRPAARLTLQAHLDKLREEGLIT